MIKENRVHAVYMYKAGEGEVGYLIKLGGGCRIEYQILGR